MNRKNETEQAAARLAELPRFAGFDAAELTEIAETGRLLTVPEHWALIVEKTPADKAYLILDGEVSIRRGGEEVARVGKGELIGEMALVNHKLRSATVVAETELEVLHFTADDIAALEEAHPNFRAALESTAGERG